MAEKLYSLGSQYLLGVHIPKNNPFATIQANPNFLKNNDFRPVIASNWSGPKTSIIDQKGRIRKMKTTTFQDLLGKAHDEKFELSSLQQDKNLGQKMIRQADNEMLASLKQRAINDIMPHHSLWEGVKNFVKNPWEKTADLINTGTHSLAIYGKEKLEDFQIIPQYGYNSDEQKWLKKNPNLKQDLEKDIQKTQQQIDKQLQ